MKTRLLVAGLALALGYTLIAYAQGKPEVLVKQRQAAMTLQGKYYGPLAQMAQGKAPYKADVVAYNASLLNALIRMPWDGFDESTSGVKSAALPVVYSEHDKFMQAADKAKEAIEALVKATHGGDEAAVKAAIGAVGKTCGGCHKEFREKKS